jgi:glutamate/tyrosine decarboxylase-like PLP-dependent enzyme
MVPGMTDDAGQDPGTGGPAPGWAWDEAEIRRVGYQVVDAIAAHLTGIAARPVFRPFPAELAGSLAQAELPAAGTAADQLLAEAGDLVLGYPLGNGHPRFWAWVNSPPHVLGVLADALAAAANPSVAGGNHAAVHIEHAVVRWFCELAGLPDTAAGLMTSGGSMATLTALAIARDQAVRRAGGDVRASGLAGLAGPAAGTGRLRLYLTAEAHSCARKAAELLGLGAGSITVIGSDEGDRMRPDLLDEQLRRDGAAGLVPLAVVASAGTVNTGAIDPIAGIADACARHGTWLHIDGAYGGPAVLLLEQFAATRAALGRADSIAIDPHKWLYAPVDAGLVLLRDGSQARDAFSLVPPYLRTAGDAGGVTGPVWFSELGFEQTRPLRALKVWLLLRHLGLDGYRQLIAHDLRMARLLAEQVGAADDLELLAAGLSVCCFRARPAGVPAARLDQLNQDLVTRLQLGGRVFLAGTTVRGSYALRACIVNPGTGPGDLRVALAAIRAEVAELTR